ncbi:Hypothetical protein ERGA_CDS_02690 [Ehrlichia ruminantium str. Gardel]|uniref:hypothetical protein n=1 Tax=Ehrlichia ruminantium TaxID=779 RepID=UPI00004C7768|nr:hypothetical protein [Ehrlichia ruminantium]CAI27721.1 Hypothetical protein ERGA_CDS_02690 [Ehrlichia ruminantium str. Gardel]
MLSFLKKGAAVVFKVATTPVTTKSPHKESLGKIIQGFLPSKNAPEKHFDLQIQDHNYKAGIELPASTRIPGHQDEVTVKVPNYKIPVQSLQKFAAWQEQDKEGDIEETKSSIAQSMLDPSRAARELLKSHEADSNFQKLKELDAILKKTGGKLTVESKPGSYKQRLNIEIDVSNKSLEDIENEVNNALKALGIRDSKLVKSSALRLYKSSLDPKVTSADIHPKDTTSKEEPESDKISSASPSAPTKDASESIERFDPESEIVSNRFSLTNPKDMPYTRSPLQSSQMLQQLQNQILMQSSPPPSQHFSIPSSIQAAVDGIAQDLSNTISDAPSNTTGATSKGKSSSSQGKVHR